MLIAVNALLALDESYKILIVLSPLTESFKIPLKLRFLPKFSDATLSGCLFGELRWLALPGVSGRIANQLH